MKLYRTDRFTWRRTQADAKDVAKLEGVPFVKVDVPEKQDEMVDFLNALCARKPQERLQEVEALLSQAEEKILQDRGADYPGGEKYSYADLKVEEFLDPVRKGAGTFVYSMVSIAIEEAWSGLPLAQKLHFAALAMEEARAALTKS